ncbi:MAG: type II secretion system secretin GspD [Mariprofundaceae bacterium]
MKLLRNIIAALLLSMTIGLQANAADVTMNFSDADLRSVIKFVAEFSDRNFLIDNRVKGKVTIISPKPIQSDDAYRVFLSILAINGFTAIESGNVTKILPIAEGKQKGLRIGGGGSDDVLFTQIIKLEHASAQQMVAVLRPLISPNSNLTAYVPGNILILTDLASNGVKVRKIVEMLDVSDSVGVRILTLEHASAEKIAKTLQGLYASRSPGKGASQRVKIMSHNPGNMLVIVADGPAISDISDIVGKLDILPKPDSGRLQVRYLKNANAEDIAKVINTLIGGQAKAPAVKGGLASAPLFAGDVRLVADAGTNSLLITADSSDRDALNRIIDQLDIRRLQVLIEAMIVEVSGNTAQQFGIEWRTVSDFLQEGERTTFGGTSFSNQAGTNINTASVNPFAIGSGLVVGLASGTISFAGAEFANLGGLLRAMEGVADTNVLSTPTLLTMDNEEAEINVGQNVPFITGQSSTQAGVANPFTTVERKDIGLILRVTPQISEGDTIKLKIYQEMSSLDGGTAAEGGFITSKRSIKTTVLASDKQIIVLGGLMRDDDTSSVQRVPCLGAIPLFGEPFKYTENTMRKTNLMVFLHPHIIRSNDDIKGVTRVKYRSIRSLYERPNTKGSVLFPSKKRSLENLMSPNEPAAIEEDTGAP